MSKKLRPAYLAWVDLETTGSEVTDPGAAILEFGMLLTHRNSTLEPVDLVAEYSAVVSQEWDGGLSLPVFDRVVADMHTKNGLLRAVLTGEGQFIEQIDADVADRLATLDGGSHIGLAGSGTSHFDRKWIDRFMPKTAKMLTYVNFDIGVVRRFLQTVGWEDEPKYSTAKTHRALEDALLHAAEAREFLGLMMMVGDAFNINRVLEDNRQWNAKYEVKGDFTAEMLDRRLTPAGQPVAVDPLEQEAVDGVAASIDAWVMHPDSPERLFRGSRG